ncbi:MAG TPA: aldo/keto reductase [Phycisphaerae bacterium]|nr:aldo/keto reductase [Phycisphaerae bacterium]
MNESHHQNLTRREFLRSTTCSAAAAGLGTIVVPALGASAQSRPAADKPLLPHGLLGRTKFPVTLVSFGAIKLRDSTHTRLLRLAIDKGVNLVHTSDSYGRGKSIQAVGALFKAEKKYRDKVFLCLKGLVSQKEADIDKMLQTLSTDHADVVLCELQNPDPRRLETIQAQQDAMKKKGKVRHTGFVCHVDMNGTIEMVVEKAPTYFDVTLIAMTMAPTAVGKRRGVERTTEQSERFVRNLKALREKGVGILSMKSGAAEAVQKGAGVYLPHLKTMLQAGADSVLTSMDAFEQVEMIAGLDLKSPHMTEAEKQAAGDFREQRAGECLMCGQCTGVCPMRIPVSDLMRYRLYATRLGLRDQARFEFAALGSHMRQTALNCGDCAVCANVCPVGLAGAKTVRDVAAMLA